MVGKAVGELVSRLVDYAEMVNGVEDVYTSALVPLMERFFFLHSARRFATSLGTEVVTLSALRNREGV